MNAGARGSTIEEPLPACEFGDFRLDARRRALTRRDGTPIPVAARALDLLVYLVRHRGALLRRDELIDALWPDADIEPNNLSQHIVKLRRLLGEKPGQRRFIETAAGRGYRFIADVRFVPSAQSGTDFLALPTADARAHEQYRQALRLLQRPTADNLSLAASLLESAVGIDPQFAQAWAWLADARLFAVNIGHAPPAQLADARRLAEHALRLSPDIAIARIVLGIVDAQHGAWLSAESELMGALALDPGDMPEGHTPALALHASMVLAQVGHLARALQQLEDAYRRMPDDPRMLMNLAMAHFTIGDDARATECARLAIAFGYPERTFPLEHLHVYAASRARCFASAAERAVGLLPESLQAGDSIRLVYRAQEDSSCRERAIAGVRDLLNRVPVTVLATSGVPMLLIEWSTLLGRLDLAFEVANRALDIASAESGGRAPNWQTLWLPELLPLRRDGRFRALAGRLGFLPYWQRHGPPDCPAARALLERGQDRIRIRRRRDRDRPLTS